MTIIIKNKETLLFDDFKFKCAVGKKGLTKIKKEGDFKTPIGIFELGDIYYRPDKVQKPVTKIKTRIIKSSDIKVNGKATDLLINLCKEVGATEYISGVGAKDYLLKQKFINNNINLKFNPPLFPLKYKQMHEKINFLNDLSAIDMIMNCGLEWENYFSYEKK